MLLSLLIGIGLGLACAALVITAYELTTELIKTKIKQELPETSYVLIEKTIGNKDVETLPVYKAKAFNRQGLKIKDIEFNYTKSEYFYDGEKIKIS